MISPGEEKAWEILESLDASAVCRNASVKFVEKSGHYVIKSFCIDIHVNPKNRIISSPTPRGMDILIRHGYFSRHAYLWYLIHAKEMPPTGKLVRPVDLRGGENFFGGSHALPMDRLAKRHEDDRQSFIKSGHEFCADILDYGDASLRLLPLPRIPVVLILWLKDEEFPSRVDLLFDSTCERQLPVDIIWCVAMMSILVMM
ncbi:MAG: DUF3786 domain-containing protein [Nitrospirota bacterium]